MTFKSMKGQEFENFEFDSYKQKIDLDLRSKVINPSDDLERKSKVRSEIMHYFYKHPNPNQARREANVSATCEPASVESVIYLHTVSLVQVP